jgi:hypothetical protein
VATLLRRCFLAVSDQEQQIATERQFFLDTMKEFDARIDAQHQKEK